VRTRPVGEHRAQSPGAQGGGSRLQDTYGVAPLIVRMGGTVPVAEVFQRLMGLDTVYFSFSTGDEDFTRPTSSSRAPPARRPGGVGAVVGATRPMTLQQEGAKVEAHARR